MDQQLTNALMLLVNATGLLKLTRQDHIRIQNAIDLIEEKLIALSPKPQATPVPGAAGTPPASTEINETTTASDSAAQTPIDTADRALA